MGSKTWKIKATSSDWANKENWEQEEAPKSGDDITIPFFNAFTTPTPVAPSFTAGKLVVEGHLDGGPIQVQAKFDWSSGSLSAHVELGPFVPGTISLTGVPDREFSGRIANAGTLTIIGPGTLRIGDGAVIVNTGSLQISDGCEFTHSYGAFPGIINQSGTMRFSGSASSIEPGVVFRDGAPYLRLIGGTTLFDAAVGFRAGASLQLQGGQIQGSGRIVVDEGGAIFNTADSSMPRSLTLQMRGGLAEFGDPTQQTIKVQLAGHLVLAGGVVRGRIHLLDGADVSWPPNNTSWLEGSALVIFGTVTVPDRSAIRMRSASELIVAGRFDITGSASFEGGILTNVGIVTCQSDTAVITLTDTRWSTTDTSAARLPTQGWPFTDNRLHRGSISLSKTMIQGKGSSTIEMISGTIHIQEVVSSKSVLALSDMQVGRAGSARLQGVIDSSVTCDGRIEGLTAGPMTMKELALSPTATVELPAEAWGTRSWITVNNRLTADGAIAVAAPPALPQTSTLSTFGQVVGRFRRLDTEPNAAIEATYSATSLTVDAVAPTSAAGLDILAWPENVRFTNQTIPAPPASVGAWFLQELYENTDWAFIGLYLAPRVNEPHHGRSDDSWMQNRYPTLKEQGWGLLPVYFGSASYLHNPPTPPPPVLTAAQASVDAAQASTLAQRAGLPTGTIIYFDLESLMAQTYFNQVVAFIVEWCDRLATGGRYSPGLYGPARACQQVRQLRAGTKIWHAGGSATPTAPVDADSHPVRVDLARDKDLTPPPDVWQWKLDYINALRFLDSEGVVREPMAGTTKNYGFDFDTAWCVDPDTGAAGVVKTYNRVSSLSASPGRWDGSAPQQVTITLSRAAAHPNGALVYLTVDGPEVQPPSRARVPAGQTKLTVEVDVHRASRDVQVKIQAWTPRQTLAAASQVVVMVSKM